MEQKLIFTDMNAATGLTIVYEPISAGGASVIAKANKEPDIAAHFTKASLDEAHILFTEATELLSSRAKIHQDPVIIRRVVGKLFAAFRGEKVSFEDDSVGIAKKPERKASGNFIANPGKNIRIDVDNVSYDRLPVRTRLITLKDKDLLPIIDEYVKPFLKAGDVVYVSEKALTITQGRVVDMSTIRPNALARFFARNVGNNYGSNDFRGFGHGTTLAMQLFLEEAGYVRILFAAAVSAVTRPLGIRGLFYWICGKRAKSIDCPMSFLILEYAHAAKLAPNHPSREAKRFKKSLGCDVVILDANYRGAFSLGKSSRSISEKFIGKLFRDNPLGQSDEMTPFCIVRKTE